MPTPTIEPGDTVRVSPPSRGSALQVSFDATVISLPTNVKPYWVVVTDTRIMYMSLDVNVGKLL